MKSCVFVWREEPLFPYFPFVIISMLAPSEGKTRKFRRFTLLKRLWDSLRVTASSTGKSWFFITAILKSLFPYVLLSLVLCYMVNFGLKQK